MVRRAFRGAFSDEEIEDIYGNAWLGTLRTLERRHEAMEDEEIRRYLLTAVANHASKELRRRRRRPVAPLEAVGDVSDGLPAPDERATGTEESLVTRDLLATMPARRRAVMLFRYGWGLSPDQVRGLVKGLTPRAYRREISRGVEELTEKVGLLERGEWCADREPVLQAYAAGIASPDELHQAKQHLAHCRPCAGFVGELSRNLHELGASLALTGGAAAVGGHRLPLVDRVADGLGRLRDGALRAFDRGAADGGDTVAGSTLASGGLRGAGATGAGLAAKLAGAGSSAKLAALCLAGGVAASACVAAGVAPLHLPATGSDPPSQSSVASHAAPEQVPPPVLPGASDLPAPAPEPAPAPGADGTGDSSGSDGTDVTQPAPAPPAPPAEQEFGLTADTTPATTGSGGGSGGGSSLSKATSAAGEFGP
jgi:DNA-directed RNA polymerase specialized sigma24 family protein